MQAAVWIFWGSLGLILYAYVAFPLLLLVRGLRSRPVAESDVTPSVSLIIVAHNEAATIRQRVENVLALEYPHDRLQTIVASDGSDDGTNETVREYAERGIELLACPRRGKIPALNAAVERAVGEVLVFSDANSMFEPDALRRLLRPLADPSVGAVAGNQRYTSSSGNAASLGERLYWRFDRWLKTMQSRAGSATSATGAIYAIRRALFRPSPLSVCDDFVISTRVIEQGYRLVFAPSAVCGESVAPTDRAEFRRKVRIISRGLRSLWAVRRLFNPLRYGFYSLQIASHKLLRWSVVWLSLIFLAASLSLYGTGWFYRLATAGQAAFYGAALAAVPLRRTRLAQWPAFRWLAVPYYCCLANAAALAGWLQVLGGRRLDVWDSTQRRAESDAGGPPVLVDSHAGGTAVERGVSGEW